MLPDSSLVAVVLDVVARDDIIVRCGKNTAGEESGTRATPCLCLAATTSAHRRLGLAVSIEDSECVPCGSGQRTRAPPAPESARHAEHLYVRDRLQARRDRLLVSPSHCRSSLACVSSNLLLEASIRPELPWLRPTRHADNVASASVPGLSTVELY
ncbi:hypothetical protein BCV70DRAFT_55205 [Testicularia cyperi]|uniref:Uncharacterized protein n=1 Tax=Testicularia cyperi TaxID=1882483 RepID=A0A317XUQ9_9BASI|nr:hypothetical protein BCV70DRAFT_55205 [Testicularia cyperi]